jgi:hypothetical protein
MDEYKRYGLDFWLIVFIGNIIGITSIYFTHPNLPLEKYTPLIFMVTVSGLVVAYKTYKWLKEPD